LRLQFATVNGVEKISAFQKARKRSFVVAGLLAAMAAPFLPPTNYATKIVARNAMSHCGQKEGYSHALLSDPATYFTQGEYRGFDGGSSVKKTHGIDLNAIYLGLEPNTLPLSKHKPTRLTGAEDMTFYSIADYINPEAFLTLNIPDCGIEKILNLKLGEAVSFRELDSNHQVVPAANFTDIDLGGYTVSFGRDEKGLYTSIYDVWDFSAKTGYFKTEASTAWKKLAGQILPLLGKPMRFYDRFYWADHGMTETSARLTASLLAGVAR
jgi:hypothetical protein